MDSATKGDIISQNQTHPVDTGSTEVQVAILTARISELTDHLRIHRHDHATRLGLLKLVGRRRRLLRYLSKDNAERYRGLIGRLGLRR